MMNFIQKKRLLNAVKEGDLETLEKSLNKLLWDVRPDVLKEILILSSSETKAFLYNFYLSYNQGLIKTGFLSRNTIKDRSSDIVSNFLDVFYNTLKEENKDYPLDIYLSKYFASLDARQKNKLITDWAREKRLNILNKIDKNVNFNPGYRFISALCDSKDLSYVDDVKIISTLMNFREVEEHPGSIFDSIKGEKEDEVKYYFLTHLDSSKEYLGDFEPVSYEDLIFKKALQNGYFDLVQKYFKKEESVEKNLKHGQNLFSEFQNVFKDYATNNSWGKLVSSEKNEIVKSFLDNSSFQDFFINFISKESTYNYEYPQLDINMKNFFFKNFSRTELHSLDKILMLKEWSNHLSMQKYKLKEKFRERLPNTLVEFSDIKALDTEILSSFSEEEMSDFMCFNIDPDHARENLSEEGVKWYLEKLETSEFFSKYAGGYHFHKDNTFNVLLVLSIQKQEKQIFDYLLKTVSIDRISLDDCIWNALKLKDRYYLEEITSRIKTADINCFDTNSNKRGLGPTNSCLFNNLTHLENVDFADVLIDFYPKEYLLEWLDECPFEFMNAGKMEKSFLNLKSKESSDVYVAYLYNFFNEFSFNKMKDFFKTKEDYTLANNIIINNSTYNNKKDIKEALENVYDLGSLNTSKYIDLVHDLGSKSIIKSESDLKKVRKVQDIIKSLGGGLSYETNKSLTANTFKKHKSIADFPTEYKFSKNENVEKLDLLTGNSTTLADKIKHTCEDVIEKTIIPLLVKMDKDKKYVNQISSIATELLPSFFESVYSNSDLIKALEHSEKWHNGLGNTLQSKTTSEDLGIGWPKILDDTYDLGDGYSLYEINSTKALKEQAHALPPQCIGGFTQRCLGDTNNHIFRVLDKDGNIYATMSVKPGQEYFEHTESPKIKGNQNVPPELGAKLDKFLSKIRIDNKGKDKAAWGKDKNKKDCLTVNMTKMNEERSKFAEKTDLYELSLGFPVNDDLFDENWFKNIKAYKQFLPAKLSKDIGKGKIHDPIDVLKSLKDSEGKNMLEVLEEKTGLKYSPVSVQEAISNMKKIKAEPLERNLGRE